VTKELGVLLCDVLAFFGDESRENEISSHLGSFVAWHVVNFASRSTTFDVKHCFAAGAGFWVIFSTGACEIAGYCALV
jgi:hypothetical protein